MKEEKINAFELLFLHAKPVKMLVALKQDDIINATHVSKTVNCTYSHTVKVLEMFKDYGLVKFDKKGRIKVVKLTDVGEDIAIEFEGLGRKFNKIKIPDKEALEKGKK